MKMDYFVYDVYQSSRLLFFHFSAKMTSKSTRESCETSRDTRKSSHDHDLELSGAKRLKGQVTDFAKCIICQEQSSKTYNVPNAALETLKTAAYA